MHENTGKFRKIQENKEKYKKYRREPKTVNLFVQEKYAFFLRECILKSVETHKFQFIANCFLHSSIKIISRIFLRNQVNGRRQQMTSLLCAKSRDGARVMSSKSGGKNRVYKTLSSFKKQTAIL